MSKSGFPAVAGENTRLLVLGSLPGEASLRQAQYYAHPQNQFWRLMGAVIGADLAGLDYAGRLDALLGAGVGLWDVIGSAERAGSLDSSIRAHTVNPLPALVARSPHLRAVAFNGAKAAALGRKALGDGLGVTLIDLPSSSPAHTAAFERKLAQWLPLRRFLNLD